MVAASKLAPNIAKFVELFESLRKTEDVPERLVLQGLATRGADGKIVLREDVREPFEDLVERLRASLDAGMTQREAAEAARLDVDLGKATHVIYALFRKDGGVDLYIGETSRTPAERFAEHPGKCTELAAAIEKTGGKDAWTCVVLLVLPEDARSKELLLCLEARIQRLLDTVDGAHGRNCHYGAGTSGGAPNEDAWLSHYVDLIEFVSDRGKTPSTKSKRDTEKTLGIWADNQRQRRVALSTHRRNALEALGEAWQWRIKAPYVTNAVMFAKLRADDRVTSSGGVFIPTDIIGVDALRVFNARQRYKNGQMPEYERAIVDAEFPGVAMTKQNASFWLNAKAFAKKHPGAKTLPSYVDEKAMYDWLDKVQRGHVGMTSWREKVLEDFGLKALLGTLKPEEIRAATVSRTNAQNAVKAAVVSVARAEAREAKRQKRIDDIAAGPRPG